MSALKQVMHVVDLHHLPNQLFESDCDKLGGLLNGSQYAWFASGSNIVLYSKQLGSVVSQRSFLESSKVRISFV